MPTEGSPRAQRHRYRSATWVLHLVLVAILPLVLPGIAFFTPLGALYFGDSSAATWSAACFAALLALLVGQGAWAGVDATPDGVTVRGYLFGYRIPRSDVDEVRVSVSENRPVGLKQPPAIRLTAASGGVCQIPWGRGGGKPAVWGKKIQPLFPSFEVVVTPELTWQGRKRGNHAMRAYRRLQAPHPIAVAGVFWALTFTAILRSA